jgi:uncharacterized protein YkwD
MDNMLTSALRTVLGARGLRFAAASLTLFAATLVAAVPGASARPRYIANDAQTCANDNTPIVGATSSEMRTAVVCLINSQRAARDLPALHVQSSLNRSAQGWTNHMVAGGQFSHGSDFGARITAAGFDWSTAAENIAFGFATPQKVVTAWMASLGHCQTILSPTYSDVGTGLSRRAVLGGGTGTWTQDFGLPMGRRAPSQNFQPADGCPYAG